MTNFTNIKLLGGFAMLYEVGGKNHPECGSGEVLLTGVFHFEEYFALGYKTARAGSHMYDSNGKVMPEQYPVFVSEKEYREKNK